MVLPHVGAPRLVGKKFEGYTIAKVDGVNHWHQFIDAVRGKDKTSADFAYAGPLTEAVLLGSVASRFPQQSLKWDGPGLKFTNVEAANQFVRRKYRDGWEKWA